METARIGEWAFLAGVIIAVLAGLFTIDPIVPLVLVVLGILVGLINISEKETTPFLVAAVALIVAGTAGFTVIDNVVANVGTMVATVVSNIAVFVAPAAVIVALKAVWALGRK